MALHTILDSIIFPSCSCFYDISCSLFFLVASENPAEFSFPEIIAFLCDDLEKYQKVLLGFNLSFDLPFLHFCVMFLFCISLSISHLLRCFLPCFNFSQSLYYFLYFIFQTIFYFSKIILKNLLINLSH